MTTTFKRKAFTLIELLIVIAIIGILFIVLVSKVDFATDKAKTTGVQTDFRSFQVAFETVSRENAGFNTLGWDTGDIKRTDFNTAFPGYSYNNELVDAGDGVRNSYDVGDINLNGEMDEDETWTGRKVYTETWTGIYTLTHPLNANDTSAYLKLEEAINKNLDPKLHITINPDTKEITMANGYQDPWKTEYHGFYLSNAAVDGKDRGAILMYSDGPNKQFGSAQVIANGVVTIGVPQNNIQGQDDLSILTIYTYFNGYGENKTTTSGFSQNQNFLAGGNGNDMNVVPEGPGGGSPVVSLEDVEGGLYQSGTNYQTRLYTWQELIDLGWITSTGRAVDGMETNLAGDLRIPNEMTLIEKTAYAYCTELTGVYIHKGITSMGANPFAYCDKLTTVTISPENTTFAIVNNCLINKSTKTLITGFDNSIPADGSVTHIGQYAFWGQKKLTSVSLPAAVVSMDNNPFADCDNLTQYTVAVGHTVYTVTNNCLISGSTVVAACNASTIPDDGSITTVGSYAFYGCHEINNFNIPTSITRLDANCFSYCKSLSRFKYNDVTANFRNISQHVDWCIPEPAGRWVSIQTSNGSRSIGGGTNSKI